MFLEYSDIIFLLTHVILLDTKENFENTINKPFIEIQEDLTAFQLLKNNFFLWMNKFFRKIRELPIPIEK